MKAFEKRFIKDILLQPRRQFRVPVYQREYSWDKNNCEQFINDIYNCAIHNIKHYMGSIVYTKTDSDDVDDCLVIDGQQRITTMLLLLKSIYDLADENNDEDKNIKNKISEALYNTNCDDRYKLKLKPIESDNTQLEYLLMDAFDSIDAKSNISINYYYFKEKIKKYIFEGMSLKEIYTGLINLEVVEIILDDSDDAQLIFESINSTGKGLTKSDLIRNFLLMNVKDRAIQEEYYKKYWLKLESIIGKESLEKYFYDFLIMKSNNYIIEDNIYENFKDYYKNSSLNKTQIFEEIVKFAKYYQLLVKNDNPEYDKKTNEICKNFKLFNHNTIYSFLMKVCDDQNNIETFSRADLYSIFELFSNYALRRLIIGIPSSSLRRFYSTLYSNVFKKEENKEKYFKAIESYLCQLKTVDKMPIDFEFKKALKESNIYKKGGILKYLFNLIENGNNKEKVDFEPLTIEHIMPQTLNSDWKKMLGEDWENIYNECINTLGNLSITGYNSKFSNDNYEIKKRLLLEVNTKILNLNKEMFEENIWNKTIIFNRAERLANLILGYFPYPVNIDNSFSFNLLKHVYMDDEEDYSDLKLYGFKFKGIEHQSKYYSNIVCELLRELYKIDPKILQQEADKKFKFEYATRITLSSDKSDISKAPMQVVDNIYLETNYNKGTMILIIKHFLDLYGIDANDFNFIYFNELEN